MAMVAGLAVQLAARRPARGRVVLLFQPAEETGKGAAAVIADPRFAEIAPDFAFALHNLPGLPLGAAALCTGPANCASRGMRITLTGKTSHAAAPQDGISPAPAIARLLSDLPGLGTGGALDGGYALVTVTHAQMGEPAFGIAPGAGEVWATLRTVTDAKMAELVAAAEALAGQTAKDAGLQISIGYDDVFDACTNHPEAAAVLNTACETAGCPAELRQVPQSWSEDFGQFGKTAKAAMFWLGSGEAQPQLHNPDYDFPDAVLPIGTAVFAAAIAEVLDRSPGRNR
jgi:metal-dependent amidase/aminoacylase/carboxypeptidase family protein